MEKESNKTIFNKSFNIKKINNLDFNLHQHSLYELVCISKGELKLTIDFQVYNLKPNTIYIIKPGQVHQWIQDRSPDDCKGIIFHFSKDFLPSYNMVNQLY